MGIFLAALALAVFPSDTACTVDVTGLAIPAPPVSDVGSYAETELHGDWAFVPTNVPGTLNSGAVAVFLRSDTGWGYHQTLLADTPGQDDMFGHALAADGDLLLVGAPGWGQDRGAVYAFELSVSGPSHWTQVSRFHSSQPVNNHRFGWSCDLSAERAIVGAGFSITSLRPVETFVKNGAFWDFESELAPAGPLDSKGFGWAVALDGNNAAVGAHLASHPEVLFGGHVFTYEFLPGGWQHETTLSPPRPTAHLRFGYKLDLVSTPAGELILGIGRQCVGPNSLDRGFVFERHGGVWSMQLEAQAGSSQCFAASVAVDQHTVAFGAPASSLGGSPSGAVHLFVRSLDPAAPAFAGSGSAGSGSAGPGPAAPGSTGAGVRWLPSGEIHGEQAFGLYGGGCALDAGRLLAWSTTQGRVHDLPESLAENYCLVTPNSAGPGATLGWLGPLSVIENQLALVVTGAPPWKAGMFLGSNSTAQVPFGQGVLCLGAPTGRATGLLFTDAQGSVVGALDFTSPPLAGANIQAGTSWHFQFVFRDPHLGEGLNSSDALTVELCP